MALVCSDAEEVVSLRWDDGAFVVDPASRLRRPDRPPIGISADEILGKRNQLSEYPQAITLEEWHRAQVPDAA